MAAGMASTAIVIGSVQLGDSESSLDRALVLGCVAAVARVPLRLVDVTVEKPARDSDADLLRAVFELASEASIADPASAEVLRSIGIDPADLGRQGKLSPSTLELVEPREPVLRAAQWRRLDELEHELNLRKSAIAERDAILRQRGEHLERLREELASHHAERERPGFIAIESELAEIKSSRAWRLLERYRLLRARMQAFRERRPWHTRPVPPAMPLEVPAERTHRTSKHDVVCFSIIDWESRWQRPQQLVSAFADEGHRVFFIRMSRFIAPGGPRYEIEELRDNVWSVTLATRLHPSVYERVVDGVMASALADSLAALREDHGVQLATSLVQIPTWRPVAELVRDKFGWPVVYDCMDEWSDFPGLSEAVDEAESAVVSAADVVIVSAQRLLEKWSSVNPNVVLARNAADFDRFVRADQPVDLELRDVPVIGFFGAIAPWFDVELLAEVAGARPDYEFVLVGPIDVDVRPLRRLSNVHLLGQQPYADMPRYLARFDVCVIPFRVNDITAATDPVKFYEYISQGKPVVSTWLPELEAYREHLYLTTDRAEFLSSLDAAIAEDDSVSRTDRVALARVNDWQSRYDLIETAIGDALPMLSAVVITYKNLDLTKQCLSSILDNTTQPRFEVVVVDNASGTDMTEYLRALADGDERVRLVLNDENRGFAAAVNQGLEQTRGDVLVIMNNDTVVPNAWQVPMIRHAQRPDVGLVVATTNLSGNESRVIVDYSDFEEMERFAATRRRTFDGRSFDIRVAAMYCMAMRREVYELVGSLDEGFGIGLFEDDDYSYRARLEGLRVICAEDAFVHHAGRAAFGKLPGEELQALWDENQRRFEEKWGVVWEPHTLRAELGEVDSR
jgi:GT2 family glycosyltransferase/glycosyltransferase involved in cell wall biosynthesis